MTQPRKYLHDVLKRDGNNFDILRLVAALLVIVGHAYAISPQPPLQDGIQSVLHFDYSGSLAVKFFFFLSGLLVTNSIVQKPNAFQFLIKRAARILPGLLVCLLVAVFFVGPLFTKLSLNEYFFRSDTWSYISRNFFLIDMQWRLPGVFDESSNGLNGSLWTLPFEATCYIYLAILFGLGTLRNKIVSNIFFLSVVAVSFLVPGYLPSLFSNHPESFLLPACFAMGALAAVNKDRIIINTSQVALIWLLAIMLMNSVVFQFVFYVALFYTLLFFSSRRVVIKYLKLPFDASYGVYVYGYMVQQCVNATVPGIGVHGNQVVSSIIALVIGILSWYFVEKPCIGFGHSVTGKEYIPVQVQKLKDRWVQLSSRLQNDKLTSRENIFLFVFFSLLAFLVQLIVLIFIFPGYYGPVYGMHSHMPPEYIPTSGGLSGVLAGHQPVDRLFSRLIGHLSFYLCSVWLTILVCMNVGLTALLAATALKIKLGWQLIIVFVLYSLLLFSHPYFYMDFMQDTGSQLAYFFLISGIFLYYFGSWSNAKAAAGFLFGCCLLSFLSSLTYAPSAVVFSLAWLVYNKKQKAENPWMPVTIVGLAVIATLIVIFIMPAGLSLPFNMRPGSVLHEWAAYSKEANNPGTGVLLILLAYAFLTAKKEGKTGIFYMGAACMIAGILSWLPAAFLPDSHYNGNSFNGTYLLFATLLFFPAFRLERVAAIRVIVVLAALTLASPFLNRGKYGNNYNKQGLTEENARRNVFGSFGPLIDDLGSPADSRKVLVDGISFGFRPLDLAQAVRSFSNAGSQDFDIVNYGEPAYTGVKEDLVTLIGPSTVQLKDYREKWTFDKEGNLTGLTNAVAEKLFKDTGDTVNIVNVDQQNFDRFVTTGFYGAENGIRWTNGNVSIKLNDSIRNEDSLVVKLQTYLPPNRKSIAPRLSLFDTDSVAYQPAVTARKDDVFYYLFVINAKKDIHKVAIVSKVIDAYPDQRTLSFPFISLKIKKNRS